MDNNILFRHLVGCNLLNLDARARLDLHAAVTAGLLYVEEGTRVIRLTPAAAARPVTHISGDFYA